MTWLRLANLALAVLALMAPVAHLLELPNKLALDGDLWLAVQQHLYRGWGPFLGGPAEIGALATSFLLAWFRRRMPSALRPTLIACLGYAGMLAAFFFLNRPVNIAFAAWTPAALPADWTNYRNRWEAGHAVAALLGAVSLSALLRADARRGGGRGSGSDGTG